MLSYPTAFVMKLSSNLQHVKILGEKKSLAVAKATTYLQTQKQKPWGRKKEKKKERKGNEG